MSTAFMLRDRKRAFDALTTPDCHWGPCFNCGVPSAAGFDCETGQDGPRQLLVRLAGGKREWRYVGPPGDPRRLAGADDGETASPPIAPAGDEDARANVDAGHREGRSWLHELLENEMQSKGAGLQGLASLVEAAGGESTG